MSYRLKETSTNKIANVAGVGIGSLYDYFPNKDAIAIALIDQRIDKLTSDFKEILENAEGSFEGLIDACLNYIEETFLQRRAFLHEIFQLAPENGRMEAIYVARIQSIAALEKCFIEKFHKDPAWAKTKAFFLMNAVMGTLEAYVILEDPGVSVETVRSELENLMLGIVSGANRASQTSES
jgi:AcrR family transcriptional regulator